MTDQTKPPAKHLPHGNYERADWFEAECTRLAADVLALTDEVQGWVDLAPVTAARIRELESALRWVKDFGSKHGMPAEVFAILSTIKEL